MTARGRKRAAPVVEAVTTAPLTVTGLTNGTPVSCRVVAHNALGDGPPSSASPPVTPATIPAAPQLSSVAGTADGKALPGALGQSVPISSQVTALYNLNSSYAQFLLSAILPAVWQILVVLFGIALTLIGVYMNHVSTRRPD